jgi:hypothetical protein
LASILTIFSACFLTILPCFLILFNIERQVKGGCNVGAGEVRDLFGTVQNAQLAMGVLVMLDELT